MFYQVFKLAENFVYSNQDQSVYDFIYKNAKNKSLKYETLINYKKQFKTIFSKGKTEKFENIKEEIQL